MKLKDLQDMAKALESEPWVLGFQTVLQERFGISGCEVKIASFVNCNLMKNMPVVNRDALYIYNALCKVIYKYGHTYVPMWKLKHNKCYEPPFTPRVYRVTTWKDSIAYLEEMHVVKTYHDDCGNVRSVYLPRIRGYEQTIVRSICKLMKKSPWVSMTEIDEKAFGGDDDQMKAAKLITTSPVVVLSGRGGCGKTHVVSTVLSKALEMKRGQMASEARGKPGEFTFADNSQSFCGSSQRVPEDFSSSSPSTSGNFVPENFDKEENAELPQSDTERTDPCGDAVLLTAPTGRAASILGKRTGLQSYTLHSVIYSYLRWLKEVKSGENHSAWKFSKVKLLVCDESSLISVKTFSTLINILMRKASLQQIILLGDKNQLPSIEPGNFLSDVYNALMPYGSSVTLRTNHRAESQLIVENAGRISRQEMPSFPNDPKRGFISLCCPSKASGDGTNCDDMAITQVVRDLLQDRISTVALPQPEKSQFIAFRRRDCLNINELCARHYNQHSIKDTKGKLDFRAGDKVCVKKNVVCFDVYTEEEVKLCNGEIFFIREVFEEEDNRNKKTTYFALDNGEKVIKVDLKMLKKAKLCHAWARTIHTYQGSEIDTVVYVVGSPIYQTCQHVYTAVTRGVRQVIVVHDSKNLEVAVNAKPFARSTKLQQFLTYDLRKPVSDEADESEENVATLDEKSERHGSDVDDVIYSQSLGDDYSASGFQTASQFFSRSASCDLLSASQGLEITDSPCNSSADEIWEDVFKEEDDEEVLAWALEVEQDVQKGSTNPPFLPSTECIDHCKSQGAGLGNTSATEDFHISRSNLKIKQERRERHLEERSAAVTEGNRAHGFVGSGDIFTEWNTPTVKSEKPDDEKPNVLDVQSHEEFSRSPGDLTCSVINSLAYTVSQGSPLTDLALAVEYNSPKTCSKKSPEISTFPTPPQTPPNIQRTASASAKNFSNTFPRKSYPPSSASFRNSGRIPFKGRRKSFTARYDTRCNVCSGPIRAGVDEITHLECGSSKSWVHQKCIQCK